MADAAVRLLDDDAIVLRRKGVRFPVELRPVSFVGADPTTWPEVEGRIEWVGGRLLYTPPCADLQQDVAVDVVHLLRSWSEHTPGFVVGGNEAGMKLGDDIRAADAAVWRRADVGPSVGRLRHVAPILAVEVAGQDEDENALRDKARWYLEHGVSVVWLVVPEHRSVHVLTTSGESEHRGSDQLPPQQRLPGLVPVVTQFFLQIDRE